MLPAMSEPPAPQVSPAPQDLEEATARIAALSAERDQLLARDREHRRRLEALRQSALAIAAMDADLALRMPELLRMLVEEARRITCADYGALGVGIDPARPFEPWVWCGPAEDQAARMAEAAPPRPAGLLGRIARDDRALRDGDAELPPEHPPCGPLLGVPLRHRGEPIGLFYLVRRPGSPSFEHEDQAVVELLAGHAAAAIEHARLARQVEADHRSREEMLEVVSQDLKLPLEAIALRGHALARSRDPRVASQARSVERAVDEMRRMIRDLLDMASLDEGRLALSRRPVDVGDLLREVLEIAAPLADDRGVALELDLDAHAPAPAALDHDRMWQVLFDLVGNGIKLTPAGGRVAVRARQGGGELAITIADTGVGIAPEALPHVFDRYFTTADGPHGASLSLYIARGLVEAHGGRISVASEVGAGTIVSIAIPA